MLPEFVSAVTGRTKRLLFAALLAAGCGINLLGSLVWYQEICHFHHDYISVRYSHPAIAVRLLANKLRGGPEVYACADFGMPYGAERYAQIFGVTARNDSLDFTGFEKFRGMATMWDGVAKNFQVPFLWTLPPVLLLLSTALFLRLWRRRHGSVAAGAVSS
jgi:hypothetical protein